MKMTFRWYGLDDSIPLEYIKQIPGMSGVVSAVYDVPVGEVWSRESIKEIMDAAHNKGLDLEVIESVPVHEDIKLGRGNRDLYIQNYKENIRRLSEVGVKVICYNFMPIFDWTRSDLDHTLEDGSSALVYYKEHVMRMDPLSGELALPGWDSSYTKEDLQELFAAYGKLDKEDVWSNLEYFLNEIIPVAEECDVKMAIHPDDPPWDIFGLPRIITNEENLDRFLALYDSEYNGLTLCSGSLGCSSTNDYLRLARKYLLRRKVHFAHLRNVKIVNGESFEESAHYSSCGSLDMVEILRAYKTHNYKGYIRPDHGRMIWGETGKPGYGLYDRALGAMYLLGIWETLEKE